MKEGISWNRCKCVAELLSHVLSRLLLALHCRMGNMACCTQLHGTHTYKMPAIVSL